MAKKKIAKKSLINLLNIAIFIVFIFALSIFNMFSEKRDFSENENRPLSSKPDGSLKNIFFGDYDTEFENYFSDQFIARDTWIGIKSNFIRDTGAISNNEVYFAKDNRLIQQFIDYDEKTVDNNIEFINNFALDNEITMNVLLIPGASYGERDALPFGASALDAKEIIHGIGEKCENVNFLEIADDLNTNKDYYFKTDHHWNQDGAFVGYEAICRKVLDKDPEEFTTTLVSDSFCGTMYSRSGAFDTPPDSIYKIEAVDPVEATVTYEDGTVMDSVYNDARLNEKDKYTYYLDGNHPIVHIETTAKTKKKAIIVKDSYAHILMPYLQEEYSEIDVLDLRYYRDGVSTLLEDKENTDVILIYGLETFVSDTNLANLW